MFTMGTYQFLEYKTMYSGLKLIQTSSKTIQDHELVWNSVNTSFIVGLNCFLLMFPSPVVLICLNIFHQTLINNMKQ